MKINPAQLHPIKPLTPGAQSAGQQLESAQDLKKAYTDFVGKTFFGQMLKAMRSTVGKAAYFDGGQGEEVFRSQLDQQLADHMSAASAAKISDPMFERQFPQQAATIKAAEKSERASLTDLQNLRRF
jgi:peptidoglycan hydrolase FlgJ